MLTPELVHVRRKGQELELVRLGARRQRALELAEMLVALARENLGCSREELEQAWAAIEVPPRDRKLLLGLMKLVEDSLVFDTDAEGDPVALRAEVFRRAAEVRKALGEHERFDRRLVLEAVAADLGTDVAAIERSLYADLRGAQVLRALGPISPRSLVESYELSQAQAILLRATRVVAQLVPPLDPGAVRSLLRKLKFLRLLASVHREPEGSWRIEIDGPYSLFESVTKYGLALALALPAIAACGRYRVVADVRWGPQRVPLRFALEGDPTDSGAEVPARLSDDAESLRVRLVERAVKDGRFEVAVADAMFDLPGVGTCVPDLVLRDRSSGRSAWIEVLGFWSRDAVWKRVELVERGLREPILFCVSERLRVSEAVLPPDAPASLLVYKGTIPVGAVLERIERLLDRTGPR